MSPLSLRVLPACLALAAVPAPVAGSGQFQPTRGDRDGDGAADSRDCAPDDPTRPARSGADADCDGRADDAGRPPVVVVLPPEPDGGPERSEQQAASRRGAASSARAIARRALGEPVAAVAGLGLGRAVAAFGPRRPRADLPRLVFVGRSNAAVSVRPSLLLRDGRVAPLARRDRTLTRGGAWVLRVRLPDEARALRLRLRVVDAGGERRTARHTVGL